MGKRIVFTFHVGILAAAALLASGCINAGGLDNVFRGNDNLDESTAAAGLKEALRIGTERTAAATSKPDGFYGNALIRIALPEQYEDVGRTLRGVGMGSYVDDFERSMNRAAERASGEAVEVFGSAITQMTIPDAFGILNGGETAATDYFRRTTAAALTRKFQPIVTARMKEGGVYNLYNDLVDEYNRLPVDKPEAVDIDDYVTDRTVDGIFIVLEGEEKRIREDPAARTTELLRRVFGKPAGRTS
jgi:hypothetical protein